ARRRRDGRLGGGARAPRRGAAGRGRRRRDARPPAQVPRRSRARARRDRRAPARGAGVVTRAAGIYRDVVGLVRALRAAGLPTSTEQSASFARALAWIDPGVRRDLCLAARSTLVDRREHTAIFDEVFEAYFGGGRPAAQPRETPLAPRHDRREFFRTALVAY